MNRKHSSLARRCASVLLLVSILPWSGLSQQPFEAIPKDSVAKYHVDFAKHFFASPEAEKADRANLYSALKELEALKGKVASSADNLQRALELNDKVQVLSYRHHAYLYLRYAVNTADESSQADDSRLGNEVDERTAFLREELIQIDDQTLAALVASRPSLKTDLYAIEVVRRHRPYTLSLKEEEMASRMAHLNTAWQSELFHKLQAADRAKLTKDSGQKSREEAFKQDYAISAAQRDLYAFSLIWTADARGQLARLRHFADAPSKYYFDSYWSRADVDDLLEGIARQADLYKRYERLRAEQVKKITGNNEVNFWDLRAVPPGVRQPRFNTDQAGNILREAFAPLGPDYGRELAALIDPSNGRMDIVPGDHRWRSGGGFSLGFIGTESVFFTVGFAGRYNDVRALAHESTHAVQRQLMNSNHVKPAYADGPHYLFESFAIFSEFLLLDYLHSHEMDPHLKQYYLEQFFEGKGMEMFRDAPEVAVEHAVYDGVRQGTIKGADDLDSLTKKIFSRYSIWPEKHDEMKEEWIYWPFLYDHPFYTINYVTGSVLALKLFEMYKKDPQHFVPSYIALLRNGFDAPPEVLLKRFLGIDLRDPALLSGAVKILGDKVNLLEESYRE